MTISSITSICTFWLSKVIFKLSTDNIRETIRSIEKLAIKLTENEAHLNYNKCSLKIYIYIHIVLKII